MTDTASAPSSPSPVENSVRSPGRRNAAAAAAAVIAAIVYLATMNRTIGFLDSGEVAAAAATLGIMHPTGYPTLTMLSWLVTAIVPAREILVLNILAALLAAAGAGVLTLLFDRVIAAMLAGREPRPPKAEAPGTRRADTRTMNAATSRAERRRATTKERPAAKESRRGAPANATRVATSTAKSSTRSAARSAVVDVPADARAIVAATSALCVAFSGIWWEQATGFEVYALQALLLPLVCLLFLRFVDREHQRRSAAAPVRTTADASLFALALGLAFTNHLMTIYLAPGFLVYYFWSLGINGRSLRRIALLVPPFVVGLLPYLYLPVRSAMHPRFNWGRPDSWQRFIDHVSGKFAWVWMFSSEEIYRAQTSYFFGRLPSELAYAGLGVAAVGLVVLILRRPRLGLWSVLLAVACVAYAGGYRIYDVELYYATAILALGVWIAAALGWLLGHSRVAAITLGALLVAANVVLHYTESDRSGNRLAEDFVHNVLATAPPNAMIFSSNAAVFVTGSYYLQEVERLRPDVTVINHDYLSNDWYVEELRDWRPELMRAVAPAVENYRDLLARSELGDVRAGLASTEAYEKMIGAFVDWQLARGHDAIVVGGLDRGFTSGYTAVPWQLGYRISRDSGYAAQPFPSYRFRHWTHIDPFAASVYEIYGRQLVYRASYEAEHGDTVLAARYRRYAATFDPQYDLEHAGELPLDAMSQVRATAEFFARLEASPGAR